jgi:hypothetical protein
LAGAAALERRRSGYQRVPGRAANNGCARAPADSRKDQHPAPAKRQLFGRRCADERADLQRMGAGGAIKYRFIENMLIGHLYLIGAKRPPPRRTAIGVRPSSTCEGRRELSDTLRLCASIRALIASAVHELISKPAVQAILRLAGQCNRREKCNRRRQRPLGPSAHDRTSATAKINRKNRASAPVQPPADPLIPRRQSSARHGADPSRR